MTMGPWWCSRESKGLRPLSWLRLSRRLRRPRSPKTDSCPRALPCSPQRHLRSGTAVASLRTVRHRVALPGRDRSPIHRLEPGCLISSFLPHTWWILSRLDGSHSLEAFSCRDLAGENSTQENWILGTHLHAGFRFNGGRRKLRGLSPRRSCSRRLRGRGRNT